MANDYSAAGEGWAQSGDGAAEGAQAEAIETGTEAPATPQAPTPAPLPVDKGNIPPTLPEASESWARDEAGRFAPKAAEPDKAVEEESHTATPAEMQKYIKAMQDGKEVDLPENTMIPVSRHGKVEMVPLSELRNSTMQERDYRIKTAELARQRQEVSNQNAQAAAHAAKMEERAKIMQEEHAQWEEARRDPAKLAQWQVHYDNMKNNPMYRQAFEVSQRAREAEAENRVLQEQNDSRIAQETTQSLANSIVQMGEEFPGIDPKEIMQRYGLMLKAGEVTELNMGHVKWLYQQAAENTTRVVQPIRAEVDELKKELDMLRKQAAAVTANAATDKVLQRAKAPNLAPKGQAPSSQKAPQKPYTSADAADVLREWSKGG